MMVSFVNCENCMCETWKRVLSPYVVTSDLEVSKMNNFFSEPIKIMEWDK